MTEPIGMGAGIVSFRQRDWQPRYRSTTSDVLHDFYSPALRASVRYDRVAGYFRSTSLAAASQGFSALVKHRGQVRLVVGADLDPKDAQVILDHQDGGRLAETLLDSLADRQAWPEAVENGLVLLAWMLKAGCLEIRVALRSLILSGLARRVLIAPPRPCSLSRSRSTTCSASPGVSVPFRTIRP